jgi:CBS domain-containing protein
MNRGTCAKDICSRDVAFVYRGVSVSEAARLMRERHVGALPVVEETERGRRVVGMLTDRDIVTAIVAKDVDPRTVGVEDAMSGDWIGARENDSVLDVLAAMRSKGVRRMPVTDASGALLGLLSVDDVLTLVADELQLVAQTIASGRSREPAHRP